jgi:hypothetical protein
MRDTSQSAREPQAEVVFLTVTQAMHLRFRVQRRSVRVEGRRMPNLDLEELVDRLLGMKEFATAFERAKATG